MKRCRMCGEVMPSGKRKHAQYCDKQCQMLAKYYRDKTQLKNYHAKKELK